MIEPLWDYVYFEERKNEKSVIQLPDNSDPIQAGYDPFVVCAVGPDVKKVKVGDRVHRVMPMGKIPTHGETYFFVQEKHIAGIYKRGDHNGKR